MLEDECQFQTWWIFVADIYIEEPGYKVKFNDDLTFNLNIQIFLVVEAGFVFFMTSLLVYFV